MQYTIRRIPQALDRALRALARRTGKSLNEVAVEALTRGAGLGEEPLRHRELLDLAGTWQEDAKFEQAIREQDRVDPALWK